MTTGQDLNNIRKIIASFSPTIFTHKLNSVLLRDFVPCVLGDVALIRPILLPSVANFRCPPIVIDSAFGDGAERN